MGWFKLEHSRFVYRLDFAAYGAAVVGLAIWLALSAAPGSRAALGGCVVVGWLAWTLVEYLLHRFVLHGLPPFSRWHGEHHRRPLALIATPTVWSAGWLLGGVYLPLLWVSDRWYAAALTLGVLAGYLAYGVVHHAIHLGTGRSAWLQRRRRWHQLHHHSRAGGCYGVSGGWWDAIFATSPSARARDARAKTLSDV